MKRTLISLALIVLLMVSIPVSAFASAEFNRSIFNGRDDLSLTADDMTGITYVRSSGWQMVKLLSHPPQVLLS